MDQMWKNRKKQMKKTCNYVLDRVKLGFASRSSSERAKKKAGGTKPSDRHPLTLIQEENEVSTRQKASSAIPLSPISFPHLSFLRSPARPLHSPPQHLSSSSSSSPSRPSLPPSLRSAPLLLPVLDNGALCFC